MKLAIIGLGGRMSGVLNDSLRKVLPTLKVVGVIDPDVDRARSFLNDEEKEKAVFYTDVSEMLRKSQPDAVAIGTRCNMHAPYAIEVLKSNLPLYLEKPVATSMKQALALASAAQKSRSEAVVGFPLRLTPLCEQAHRLLREGAIGNPEHFLGVNYVSYGSVYFDSWYKDYKTTQGLFLQKATHDLDYMSYLANSPIVRVAAMLSKGRVYKDSSLKKNAKDQSALFYDGIGTPETGMNEDSSSTLLEFANGAQGIYTQIFYTRRDAAMRGVTVSGRLGTLSFDWCQSKLKLVRHYEPLSTVTTVGAEENHSGGDMELAKSFVDVVLNGAKSRSPLSAGLQSVFACLAAKASAEKGAFVNVHQI